MTELRDELRRASRAVSPPDVAADEMLRRGERHRRASRAGTAAFALGLTVVVLGGALFGLSRLGGGTPSERTGEGGDLTMGSGQYHYLKVRSVGPGFSLDGGAVSQEPYDTDLETWWALDDSGRIAVAREGGGYGQPEPGTFGPGEFPLEAEGITDISHLSTDPATLQRQLEERHGENGASPQPEITPGPGQDAETGKLVRDVTYLITWPNATPALRQALFEVAADLPTVQRRDGVEDPVGRDAIELSITTEDTVHTMYFDPATRLWMGTVETYGDGLGSPHYQLVLAEGFTGSTDDAADEWFFPGPQRELTTA
jgi:hypothetical protein